MILEQKTTLSKSKTEQVQKKKHEYYLLGAYFVHRGLSLFSYNPVSGEIKKVQLIYPKTVYLKQTKLGDMFIDEKHIRADIDSKNIHFQALNFRTAKERVKRYKEGKIELFNLIKPNAHLL